MTSSVDHITTSQDTRKASHFCLVTMIHVHTVCFMEKIMTRVLCNSNRVILHLQTEMGNPHYHLLRKWGITAKTLEGSHFFLVTMVYVHTVSFMEKTMTRVLYNSNGAIRHLKTKMGNSPLPFAKLIARKNFFGKRVYCLTP